MSLAGTIISATANNVVDRPLFNRQEILANIPEPYKAWTSISIDRWEKFARINDTYWNFVTANPPANNQNWAGVTLFPATQELTINLGVDVTMQFNSGFATFNEPLSPVIAFVIPQTEYAPGDNSSVFTANFVMAYNLHFGSRPAEEWIDTITHELGHALGIITHADQMGVNIDTTTDSAGNEAGLMNLNGQPYDLTQSAYNTISGESATQVPVADATRASHFTSRDVGSLPGVPTSLMAQFALPTGRGLRTVISDLELKLMRDTGAFDEVNPGNNEGDPFTGNIDDLRIATDPATVTHCGHDHIDFDIEYFGPKVTTVINPTPTPSDVTLTLTGAYGTSYYITSEGNDPAISIQAGATLTIVNNSGGHPVDVRVSNGGPQVTQGTLTGAPAGNGQTLTWDTTGVTPGTYYYQCILHPSMIGTITVTS